MNRATYKPWMCVLVAASLLRITGCGQDEDGGETNDNGTNGSGPFTLTVNLVTAGAGSVALDPAGDSYDAGTSVEVTVTANPTYTFAGFSGDATGSDSTITITMDADKTITATFVGNLFVSDSDDDDVLEFDALTGEFVGEFVSSGSGGLDAPLDLVFSPDGTLLVASQEEVLAYDGDSGEPIESFVSTTTELGDIFSHTIGPNGNLFVGFTFSVLEFDGETGDEIGEFVAPGSGSLGNPQDITFGTSDNLFVLSSFLDGAVIMVNVLAFDGQSGQFLLEFVEAGSGGLSLATDFTFGPNGNLFVPNNNGAVLEFDSTSGVFVGEFARDDGVVPLVLAFGPNDNLFASAIIDDEENKILEYDGQSGELLGTFVDSDQLNEPSSLVFKPLP